MATIVIHAGMPKTGSTSIQRWIAENSARLRQHHGVQVLAAKRATPGNPGDGVRLGPYEAGDVTSNWLFYTWLPAEHPSEIQRQFFGELTAAANEYPKVLMTGEALSHVFAVNESFLQGFEDLTRDHNVRIAYYVRPQHTALEAACIEAGYMNQEFTPSEWVLRQTWRLRYLNAMNAFRKVAPNVDLGMRPFIPDLLDGGSPVEDFARRFLELDEDFERFHENPGLPLELVNVLRHSPDGWFWKSMEHFDIENFRRSRLAGLLDGSEFPTSERIRRSRNVLQQHCYEVFEAENREVIRRNGWRLGELVPSAALGDDWDISELDTLWEPEASRAEQSLIHRALRAALTNP